AQPLTQLTRKNTPFLWTEGTQKAFDNLRTRFTTAPILLLPDPSKPYSLEVDASGIATGAVLSQRDENNDRLHPVAFFSRKLSPAEVNYSVGDRELLAIKNALEEWRHLLEGTLHPTTIFTDHKNLEYLRSARRLCPRLARWALFFSRFSFHITYRPGSKNGKADALSRLSDETPTSTDEEDTVLHQGHFLATQTHLLKNLQDRDTSSPHNSGRLFIPPAKRLEILHLNHDAPTAGHGGIRKTLDLILRHFWWPSVSLDVQKYVKTCDTCNRCKVPRTKVTGLLQPLPVPLRPWSSVSVDFIVDLPPSRKHTTIMVVVDRLSKMAHFIPTQGSPSAKDTANLFFHHVFRLHGTPETIISDRGPQFTSRFWKAFCTLLHISVCLSTAFHPHSNGQTERTNQTLEQYLRCYTSYLQDDWSDLLTTAEFAYNSQIHTSIKQSPFYTNYGFHPSVLPDTPPQSPLPLVNDHIQKLQQGFILAKNTLLESQNTYKKYADLHRKA
uniref:Gypsy retrotransposon integrase-like protein 1 n=1 Tax=Leptobrachium leishanense TaxID=445787 RepID=A0A8C5LR95_9ANUR